ncbi:MAG TPA: tannase/feruloyl esterase family alpha/beta hydrolase [Candidatus Dormibacteraeota bacterium]|nr:tannase/feruloyl esterase family alpha/beta hydrolase [Candidatus Dormibacteraeota bacterium]
MGIPQRRIVRGFGALCALALTLVLGAGTAGTAAPAIAPVARADVQPATTPIAPRLACAALAQPEPGGGVPDFGRVPGAPTRVASAAVVPATATAPEFCDVKGYVAPQVQFELKLPTTTWQGRYLQSGCGGFCGAIGNTTFPSCDLQPGGDFAVAATNDGHVASGVDALWAATDEQIRIDLGTRAVHVTALAAKAIIAAFYGAPPARSYFNGCSDGGREALSEAQRFPVDFDGIVAGAPANIWAPLNGEFQAWLGSINVDASGAPILTQAKLPALHSAALAACDGVDGLVDGQIDDPRACAFDPMSVRCAAGTDQPTCLTPDQVAVARKAYSGPVDAHGRHLYPGGEPVGSELAWAGWFVTPAGVPGIGTLIGDNYLKYSAFPIGQPTSSTAEWHFDIAGFNRLRAEARVFDATSPDLDAFRARGGKLILWQGWADQAIPPTGTPAYYQAVQDRVGGLQAAQRFARLFMFPSVYHCGGGFGPSQFDLINPIVHWVEQGTAPTRIVATQTDASGTVVRTRPVFAYPEQARYTGKDSINDAANFVGVMPAHLPDDHFDWVGQDLFGPGR